RWQAPPSCSPRERVWSRRPAWACSLPRDFHSRTRSRSGSFIAPLRSGSPLPSVPAPSPAFLSVVKMLEKTDRIVVTGAAGLVGQNLVTLLLEEDYRNIVAIDKHSANLATLHGLHPEAECVVADLAEPGEWSRHFHGAEVVVQLHAQITGISSELFVRNN